MVRNFFIRGVVDGRKTEITGGSSRKDGGMRLLLTQRSNGEIIKCLSIECVVDESDLVTTVFNGSGELIYEHKTKR